MAMVLVVLTPNGRRESVKVTPNTSILQVLEDVCLKHGFNPLDYDLKHYSRIVEPSNSVRFSGLPNKATLEMVLSTRPRQEGIINLGLQLGSGKRLTHTFQANDTLWDVIKYWQDTGEVDEFSHVTSDESGGSIQPVCVYMRQEIVGEQQLRATSLRSLGLTVGSACIRLLHRNVEQLGYQANVSTPLSRHSSAWVKSHDNDEDEAGMAESTFSPTKPQAVVKPRNAETDEIITSESQTAQRNAAGTKRPLSLSPIPMDTEDLLPRQVIVDVHHDWNPPSMPLDLSTAALPLVLTDTDGDDTVTKPRHSLPGALNVLGPHNAVLYHADDVKQPSTTNLPDSFFEVTRSDVESIWRDLQAKRRELEDLPLTTQTTREQELEANILRNLREHPVSIVRVRFQNRYVLQGTFRAVDTVNAIMNMVRTYLTNPELDFYLFTSPPKRILDGDRRLIEQDIIHSAVLYFGTPEYCENPLKPEVCNQLSCPEAVGSYLDTLSHQTKPGIDPISLIETHHSDIAQAEQSQLSPVTDQPGPSSSFRANQPSKNTSGGRVPKWYKPN